MFKKLYNRLKKLSVFKKGLLIYSSILVIIVTAFFTVLWTYLASYQNSLPRSYAENYVKNMGIEEIRSAFLTNLEGKCLYETEEEAADALCKLLLKDVALRARKDATNSTSERPVFNIYCGKNSVAKLCLKRAANGAYGFERWEAESLIPNEDILELTAKHRLFTIPSEATLFVNGYEVDKSIAALTGDPFCSPLEKSSALSFVSYDIAMPYSLEEISVKLNGVELENFEGDEYNYPEASRITVKINAPTDALVYVNGLKLPESYITEKDAYFPFLSVLESKSENTPKSNIWEVKGLTSTPDIKVICRGRELKRFTDEGNCFYYIGNDVKLTDYTLYAPSGATVTVNGIDITDEYLVNRNSPYPEMSEYIDLLVNPVTNSEYVFKGLINPPQIGVVFDGNSVSVSEKNGVYSCNAAPSDDEINEYDVLATDFTKTLISYMFGGRDGLNERLSATLAFTKHDSAAYNKILDTYSGAYYIRQMDITYNALYVDGYISYAENAFYCVVHYDIFGKNPESGRTNTAAGEYKLTFIESNDEWLLYDLLLY